MFWVKKNRFLSSPFSLCGKYKCGAASPPPLFTGTSESASYRKTAPFFSQTLHAGEVLISPLSFFLFIRSTIELAMRNGSFSPRKLFFFPSPESRGLQLNFLFHSSPNHSTETLSNTAGYNLFFLFSFFSLFRTALYPPCSLIRNPAAKRSWPSSGMTGDLFPFTTRDDIFFFFFFPAVSIRPLRLYSTLSPLLSSLSPKC